MIVNEKSKLAKKLPAYFILQELQIRPFCVVGGKGKKSGLFPCPLF
jgi:hypothetical protein